MILVMYDISSIKTQSKVRKYLKKYGRAIQYSVYEIHNTTTITQKIISELTQITKNQLKASDSIIIIPITDAQLDKAILLGSGGFDTGTYIEI
jgi:CRISPR-associated endonuclease Cas2